MAAYRYIQAAGSLASRQVVRETGRQKEAYKHTELLPTIT